MPCVGVLSAVIAKRAPAAGKAKAGKMTRVMLAPTNHVLRMMAYLLVIVDSYDRLAHLLLVHIRMDTSILTDAIRGL